MKKQHSLKKLVLRRESLREIGSLLDQVRAGVVGIGIPVLKPHKQTQTNATNPIDGGGC
jgi:hypothetical protein